MVQALHALALKKSSPKQLPGNMRGLRRDDGKGTEVSCDWSCVVMFAVYTHDNGGLEGALPKFFARWSCRV
jgi:hypothetical protein